LSEKKLKKSLKLGLYVKIFLEFADLAKIERTQFLWMDGNRKHGFLYGQVAFDIHLPEG